MKANLFMEMSNEELQNKIISLKEELFNLRFKHETRQLENPNQLNIVKKDIARAMTVMRLRQLGYIVTPVNEKEVAKKKKNLKKSSSKDLK